MASDPKWSVFQLTLSSELKRRKAANSRYSLRAFARSVGIDASLFSKILKGHIPTVATAERIADGLGIASDERAAFLKSLVDARAEAEAAALPGAKAPEQTREIGADEFQVISRLYHYGLLEMTYLADFSPDPRWIARRLGITKLEAQYAIDRLLRLGLLERRDGTLVKTSKMLATKDKARTGPALIERQKETLKLAALALERVPIERRSANGMTMAIDPAKLPIAKALIIKFAEELCQVLEVGERTALYQLTMHLFPLDSRDDGESS